MALNNTGTKFDRFGRLRARRGVSSVLAMMFMVIFGSLAAAMAVVAQSNLRTADSSLKVSRAMSAAETGMTFAGRRLNSEASRFVIEKGEVTHDYALDLWMGTYNQGADGNVEILPPEGYTVVTPPDGIVFALADVHSVDTHTLSLPGDVSAPTIDPDTGTLRVPPVAVTEAGADGPYFRLKYELLADSEPTPGVLVTAQGVDKDVTRTIKMAFLFDKRIEFAILSPNRIMIGKNVRVEGPLGSRYGIVGGELDGANGDPLVMRSDFYWLDSPLDEKLDTFFQAILDFDLDGDARLRPYHPSEGAAQTQEPSLEDYNGDEYIDDFDVFLSHYDINNDERVVFDAALASAAGHGSLNEEFADVDEQLARLIDEARPDRNGDGIDGGADDTSLGFQDGIIDSWDLYAKVHGRLAFSVNRTAWETAHGDEYQTVVEGPIRMPIDQAPVEFEVTEDEMREVTTEMFSDTQAWHSSKAIGNFQLLVDAQIFSGSGIYTAPVSDPEMYERIPYQSTGAYDFYDRPIYENMLFLNTRIPKGNNGLFKNCIFVGVTYVETEVDCNDENWNYAGSLEEVEDPDNPGEMIFQLRFPGLTTVSGGDVVDDSRTLSNNLRFDNCTFLGAVSGDKPDQYTHWRNKLQFTGQTRFFVQLDDPDLEMQPDHSWLTSLLAMIPSADRDEMEKSSILMPGWSIDVGNFTNEQAANPADTPTVRLRGTIVAGILDARGTVDIHGTLLATFRPAEGEGPLFYGGLTDAFNTTIGYFGPMDGDNEGVGPEDPGFNGFGEITLRYDPDAKLPDGIPWPISAEADPMTYVEEGGI